MRRLASLALLALFLLLSGAPLLVAAAADADAGLPACCRRHGKHHCAMLDAWLRARRSGRPVFTAPPMHCPFYPQPGGQAAPAGSRAGVLVQAVELAQPPLLGRSLARPVRRTKRQYWGSNRQKRGPPAPSPTCCI